MPPERAPGLRRLQRLLLARLWEQRPARDADDPALWIAGRSRADSAERIDFYRRMYLVRLGRELEREFPATCALLGSRVFAQVARDYVAAQRSRSYTLLGYGKRFPERLRRTSRLHDEALRAAAADLARLERALAETRLAPSRPAPPAPGALGGAPGARLLSFAWAVDLAYAQFLRGETVERPRSRRCRLAIYRRGEAAHTLSVSAGVEPLLRSLLRERPLEAAVAAASARGLRPAELRKALERWVGNGLFGASIAS